MSALKLFCFAVVLLCSVALPCCYGQSPGEQSALESLFATWGALGSGVNQWSNDASSACSPSTLWHGIICGTPSGPVTLMYVMHVCICLLNSRVRRREGKATKSLSLPSTNSFLSLPPFHAKPLNNLVEFLSLQFAISDTPQSFSQQSVFQRSEWDNPSRTWRSFFSPSTVRNQLYDPCELNLLHISNTPQSINLSLLSDLHFNNLNGTIPQELGNLSSLINLCVTICVPI
jgi:hypothetical protein